jgi:hypothetical protein
MYILTLKYMQLNLGSNHYTEVRKLIDTGMRANFKYFIYIVLISNLTLIILTIQSPESLIFITSTIAFLGLLVDTVLTVKGSLPINDIINTWTSDTIPKNWTDYRKKWLNIFQYRQIANIIGFVSLLIGVVFGTK